MIFDPEEGKRVDRILGDISRRRPPNLARVSADA